MGVWVVGTVEMMMHVKAVGPGWHAETNKSGDLQSVTGQRGRALRTSSVRGAATLDSVHCCFETESWIFGSLLRGWHEGGVNGAVVGEW